MNRDKLNRAVPTIAKDSNAWFDELPDLLSAAVDKYRIEDKADWEPLSELSGATEFQGIDVDAESSVILGEEWIAPASVYVTLVYDPSSADPVSMSDSYPAKVHYRVKKKGKVHTIDVLRIEVDNSSFYE